MSSNSMHSVSIVPGEGWAIQPELVADHNDAAISETDNGNVPPQPESVLGAIGKAADGLQSASSLCTHTVVANYLTATEMNAQAGLNWLSAQPLDLERVREALDAIANNSKRTREIVLRLRASMRGPQDDALDR